MAGEGSHLLNAGSRFTDVNSADVVMYYVKHARKKVLRRMELGHTKSLEIGQSDPFFHTL